MTAHIRPRTHAAVGATLLACLLGSASAGTTIYDGPIDALPPDCGINLYLSDIIDPRPVTRPVFQAGALQPRTNAQQLPGAFPTSRQVAFTTNFSRLNMQIPPYMGVFSVSQVRATVYAGPSRNFPVVANQVRTDGTASMAWSATATENRSLKGSYQSKWLVAVQSIGQWKTNEFNPWLPASVMLDCTMTVKPPATTVLPVLQ